MRRFLYIAGVVLLAVTSGRAQVLVEVVLDQERYLRDESLPVKVRITNRSGQALKLGREEDWLSFALESRDGHNTPLLSDIPVKDEFTLPPSMVATRRVDIAPYYDLSMQGRYTVSATVKIPGWNEEVSSKPKTFEIVHGANLWEQLVGVPVAGGGAPEVRKYVLQQAHMKHLMLYVRITDANENKTYRLMPIGGLVSFSRPEPQVDKDSNLHLLFQTGARSFSYTIITPKCDLILRQRHDYTRTRPVLRSAEDGRIYVAGGQRSFAADDVPPPITPTSTNNVSALRP
jgi:hypothetical protein